MLPTLSRAQLTDGQGLQVEVLCCARGGVRLRLAAAIFDARSLAPPAVAYLSALAD